jgi:FtsZ-binding cell division protein ZapB
VLCNLKDALKHEPKITLFSQNAYDAVCKKYDELKPDFQNWQDTIQATKTFITRGFEPLENASIVPAIALKPLETEITSITALWKYLWKDTVYFEFLDMAIHKRFEYASAHDRYNQALSWAEMTIIGHLNKVASLSTCRIEYRPTLEQGIEQYNILAQDLEALTQSPNCLDALKLLVATDKPAIWQQAIEEKQLCLLSAKNKHIKRMTILSNMLKAVSAIIINFGQCHTSVEAWNHHQKLKQQVDELTELPNLVAYQKLNEIEEAYNNRVELIKIKQQTIQYLARINFETHLNSFLALTQQLTETHQSKAAEILCHELVTARLTFEAATGTFDANKNTFMAECRDALRKSKSVFEQHNNWQRTMNTFISTLVTCTTIGRYHFMPPPKQKILTGIAEMEHTLILR